MLKFVDIETNGLNPDIVWCMVINDDVYTRDNMDEGLANLSEKGHTLVFHNGIDFDLPVLNRLYGFEYDVDSVYDTIIMSRLMKSDRAGGHGLKAWGERLHIKKLPDLDWNTWDEGLIERCKVDVQITKAVYYALKAEEAGHDWSFSKWIEHHIAHYHQRQRSNGVKLDVPAAIKLADRIQEEADDAKRVVESLMPWIVKPSKAITLPFKKTGGYKQVVVNLFDDPSIVWGAYMRVDILPPNSGSPKQLKDMLFSIGWVPDEFNYVTDSTGRKVYPPVVSSPKLSESSLRLLGATGEAVNRLGMLGHRLSLLRNRTDDSKGLVNKVVGGRIAADGIPMGTPTGRYTHSGVVNIPKAAERIPYGKEIRDLFIAEDGYELAGSDADGLEARMEAHYTYPYDNGAYARELLDGDIHQHNADIWGVIRDLAKNGKYCLSYGGQAPKLASTLGIPSKLGKKYFDMFWDGNIALSRLKKDVERALTKGYLIGIDGRKLFIRSKHSALNMLFQSAGSITVKLATIYMNQELDKAGFDWKQVLHMHDEFLLEWKLTDDERERAEEIISDCWRRAGKRLRIQVPITGDTQVGRTWGSVH